MTPKTALAYARVVKNQSFLSYALNKLPVNLNISCTDSMTVIFKSKYHILLHTISYRYHMLRSSDSTVLTYCVLLSCFYTVSQKKTTLV